MDRNSVMESIILAGFFLMKDGFLFFFEELDVSSTPSRGLKLFRVIEKKKRNEKEKIRNILLIKKWEKNTD